jgi:hypothetical protein
MSATTGPATAWLLTHRKRQISFAFRAHPLMVATIFSLAAYRQVGVARAALAATEPNRESAMPKIVISYRRSDSTAIAGRIFDRLTACYGKESVFLDVENIPFGIDFRKSIEAALLRTDVLLVVVGPQWIGPEPGGPTRIDQANDPVRVEVEIALAQAMLVIPLLVDGAKMPTSAELPESLRDFAFLNAAEVAAGRDFHGHMERLIYAIDQAFAVKTADVNPAAALVNPPAPTSAPNQLAGPLVSLGTTPWRAYVPGYFVLPLAALLISHHLIINSFDLNTTYLRVVSFVVPLCFGFLLRWRENSGIGAAVLLGLALATAAVTGMDVSESLNSGDPILPTTAYEWRENIEYTVTISACFVAAHIVAGGLRGRVARSV